MVVPFSLAVGAMLLFGGACAERAGVTVHSAAPSLDLTSPVLALNERY